MTNYVHIEEDRVIVQLDLPCCIFEENESEGFQHFLEWLMIFSLYDAILVSMIYISHQYVSQTQSQNACVRNGWSIGRHRAVQVNEHCHKDVDHF